MRRHPNNLLRNLLIASLIILAATHPAADQPMAPHGPRHHLAHVQSNAHATTHQPGAAAIAGLAAYIAHQIRSHRPRTATAPH